MVQGLKPPAHGPGEKDVEGQHVQGEKVQALAF
jgi:hypothetical protein